MVFGPDREALVTGIGGRALGYGPGHQYAAKFEPEVVMQAGSVVLLDDEASSPAVPVMAPRWFFRFAEIALAAIGPELVVHDGYPERLDCQRAVAR